VYKIPAKSLFMGKNLIYVPECHSTNTLLAEFATRQNLAAGTVLITTHQVAGRGQRGAAWVAEPGKNITASFLVVPNFLDVQSQFMLTQWVSLAVAQTIELVADRPAAIKWPNDVLIGSRKVCGILIENSLTGGTFNQSIIGIGLNVNQQVFPFAGATSLHLETGRIFSLQQVFEALCAQLERGFLELRSGRFPTDQYLFRLYGRGQRVPLADASGDFEGLLEGVTPGGKLLVVREDGPHVYGMKEIRFRGVGPSA
jgi:BirA family biotin operon repressor/biotin-[acetyl-CoA-carboxylase] ligase